MKKLVLILIITASFIISIMPVAAQVQKQSVFKNFVSKFPSVKLPFYIAYDDTDFLTEQGVNGTDTCTSFKGVMTINYADSLSFEEVRAFLLNDSERIVNKDSDWYYYYSIGSIATKHGFLILLYGETEDANPGYVSREKQYLCTVTKKGKLISKLWIGAAGWRGEYFCGSDSNAQGGVVWVGAYRQSCINNDLTIKMGCDNMTADSPEIEKKSASYYIDEKGYIQKNTKNPNFKSPCW